MERGSLERMLRTQNTNALETVSAGSAWSSRSRQPRIALALGGGGARAAYQAGVLSAIARYCPQFRFPCLTGVSAGAINISLLANHPGSLDEQSETLLGLWRRLRLDNVFATGGWSLLCRALRIGMQLTVGTPPGFATLRGMVNTDPLRQFLKEALGTTDGSLPGIRENIDRGHLDSVVLTALSYGTGKTVSFYQGQYQASWDQPFRCSIHTPLSVEHAMASAALPLFFPPIEIKGDWYGDGGIRLVNPLAPAIHTGADRILAISNHYLGDDVDQSIASDAPSPATVMAAMYNAVFLDQLDQDVLEMQVINNLLRRLPPDERCGMRDIKLLVIRPSRDIGHIAYQLRHSLPSTLSYLMGRLGTGEVRSKDFLSTVMFHATFIEELIQLGLRDGEAMKDEVCDFLRPDLITTGNYTERLTSLGT